MCSEVNAPGKSAKICSPPEGRRLGLGFVQSLELWLREGDDSLWTKKPLQLCLLRFECKFTIQCQLDELRTSFRLASQFESKREPAWPCSARLCSRLQPLEANAFGCCLLGSLAEVWRKLSLVFTLEILCQSLQVSSHLWQHQVSLASA